MRFEDLKKDLALRGYTPFCTVTTLRRKYKKGPFIIDLDEGRWEDATAQRGDADDRREDIVYTLAEIELMVNDASETEAALHSIKTFAEQNGLTFGRVHGKAVVYLKEFRPEHFRALVKAGVVGDY